MNLPSTSRSALGLAWLGLGVLIFLVYMPGLSGDYVFDDLYNIVNNSRIQLKSLRWDEMRNVMRSGDAGPLGRPLSVLSFALNYYATGLDPFFFKLTNLLIHLGNTLLVGLLAQVLLARLLGSSPSRELHAGRWWAWAVAALWGLHPLNLTSVLYVVQRMTSLSTFFGLLALVTYANRRARGDLTSSGATALSNALVGGAVAFLLVASVLSKESGLLFVPLMLWIEYTIFGFRTAGDPIRVGRWRLRSVVTAGLLAATAFIAIVVLPRMLTPEAFANRDFTMVERGLTETRVLFYYLRLLVLPRNSDLSLYHDDIEISRGLFEPSSTVFAILALAIISLLAFRLRRSWPVLLFAWGWFLISHALESTIFSLELVHEHRNYFATLGFFVAVPVVLSRLPSNWYRVMLVPLAAYALVLLVVTWTRSEQWSNNVDNALLEASNHPHSARANYNLGRTYLRLLDKTGEERFGPLADQAFHATLQSYNPGLSAYFALIHSAYYRGMQADPRIVSALKDAFRTQPFYNDNVSFLQAFLNCQIDGHCHMPDMEAVEIFVAALDNPYASPRSKAEIYKLLAQYFISRFKDLNKGIEFIEDALAVQDEPSTRIMYAQAFRLSGRYPEAATQIEIASRLDRRGFYHQQIERERASQRLTSSP